MLGLRRKAEIKVHIMCIGKKQEHYDCDCAAVVGWTWRDTEKGLSNLYLSSADNCVNPILVSQRSALITSLLIVMSGLTEQRLWP